MKTEQRDKLIARLLKLPPVAWPATLARAKKRNGFTSSDMDDLRRSLDDAAERCAFLSGYVARWLGCDGCGEKTPDDAAKNGQRIQKKVTAALGYIPQYRRPFFSGVTVPEE